MRLPKPHGFTGWIDEDRDGLRSKPLSVWIDWFEYRVHLVSINPIRHILETQITADPDSSALLIAGVSLCSTIEATGKFITGVDDAAGRAISNRERFGQFVTDYMSNELNAGYIGKRSYSTILWTDFRNGLAHGFSVCGGGFNGNRGNPYFGQDKAGNLTVNPAALFDDFMQGFTRYVFDLRAGDPRVVMFEKMFLHVFINGK